MNSYNRIQFVLDKASRALARNREPKPLKVSRYGNIPPPCRLLPLVAGVMSRWGVMISITIPSHCIDYVALVGTSFIIHMVYLLLINANYLSKNISPFLW